jgi:predicted PurR-regulated permease PerM
MVSSLMGRIGGREGITPMRIFLHGKTRGFILLRTLITSAAIMLILTLVLVIAVFLFRQGVNIKNQAERLLSDRNLEAYRELNER